MSNDRRFFARSGELLYLMLCRSGVADQLRDQLVSRFLENPAPYDSMARALQNEPQFSKSERGGAYLPCSSHPIFDRLRLPPLDIPLLYS